MDQLTVLLPARNAEATVGKAIASVLRGLPDDAKVLVLDDASEDRTPDVIKNLARKDRRVAMISTTSASGVAGALNILLEACETALIARMDADDITLPWRFAVQMRELAKHNLDMVFMPSIQFGPSRTAVRPQPPIGAGPTAVPYELLTTNTLLHPTLVGRRSTIVAAGGYRTVPAEDWDLFMRMALRGDRLARTSMPGLLYRRHVGQVTQTEAWRTRPVDSAIASVHDDLADELIGCGRSSYAALSGATADSAQLASALDVLDAVWTKSAAFSWRDRFGVRANVIGVRRQLRGRYSNEQFMHADRVRVQTRGS
ncbi:glycosyltransferase family 2 protein [Mycolicibacterium moriokaense]|uniref:Glycosyl transferase family 2 n=1 Tax=Mycolicibacterium moriokaense TaxID=39691 RepID=A0A318HGU1_9MYCO|nr:glycosyltransferase family 2 protein [Mycolicibacterium moriokaense]PXX03202.1 glycosyl transferase family 2 [Mycolicibacterium moriokaense]